ncbi:MAG: spore protease YyaC [Lachnospiraceae bacterium]|nr:spore protease YyaC [Lachnospiraceae bacterium]
MSATTSIQTGLHSLWRSTICSEPRLLDPEQLAQLLAATASFETGTIRFNQNKSAADKVLPAAAASADFSHTKPVILCIGTDRIVGDSLGPLTGSLLKKSAGDSLAIYGTLETPVHACNLAETLAQIKKKHPDSAIIAVDASLGCQYKVGSVLIRSGSIRPGMGVKKELPAVGDISITGIAGAQSSRPYLVLQSVRLSLIMSMAEHICKCILDVCG